MSALKKFRAEKSATYVKDGIAAVRMQPTESNRHPLPATFTPLEQQVVNLRMSLPSNMILVIMCGYKMKCFGRDARVVARRLGFMCMYPESTPFEYCSFPVQRTVLHCSRLVAMGYHVGVVEQLDSAAARAAEGSGGSKLFERKLTKALSKASVPDFSSLTIGGGGGGGAGDEDDADGDNADAEPSSSSEHQLNIKGAADEGNFVLFISEDKQFTELTFVSLASRVITHKRIEKCSDMEQSKYTEECIAGLQAGLLCYAPVEIVYAGEGDLSQALANVISSVCRAHRGPSDEPADDSCDLQVTKMDMSMMESYKKTIADRGREAAIQLDTQEETEATKATQPLMDLYFSFFQATGALRAAVDVPYLYRQETTMHLPPATLLALDVFPSRRNGSDSLFMLVNRSMTSCGARRLRSWLAAPMCDLARINARQHAIQSIASDKVSRKLLKAFLQQGQGSDIEVTMTRLIAGRCSYNEYRTFLEKISALRTKAETLAMEYNDEGGAEGRPMSKIESLLTDLISDSVSDGLKQEALYCKYGPDISLEDVYLKGLKPLPPSLQAELDAIKEAEETLEVELEAARAVLKLPSLAYKTVALVTNLIEVPPALESKVPKHWMVMSRVKAATRYRTEEIVHQCAVRTAAGERLAVAAQKHFIDHQKLLYSARSAILAAFSRFVNAVADFDALQSLATLANAPGYSLPTLVRQSANSEEAEVPFVLRGLAHPMASAHTPNYVTCDVAFANPSKLWLITGPNMGGKSALMRSVALCSILGQAGAHVPATEATLPVFTSIWCRMGAHDDLLEGSSTFMMEMRETRDIITAPDLGTSLVLMDELGRGTSSYDGVAVADAVLNHVLSAGCHCMFVTHYHLLTDWHRHNRLLQLKYMSYAEQEEGADDSCPVDGHGARKRIVFLYQPVDGVTPSSFGINVAAMAGLPEAILGLADRKSHEAERRHSATRALHLLKRLAIQQ